MRVPEWPPRDWRAIIALTASIAGAVVLTGFSMWLVKLLVMFARADPTVRLEVISALATSNYALLAIIGAVLLSLGLAINRRIVKGSVFGASFVAASAEDEDADRD
jgi:drug/metabolite transporter (DMT)-like permease